MNRSELRALLMREGFIAYDEEADELLAAAGGDERVLQDMVDRRLTGEPLAWITGSVAFCGLTVAIHEGVYVPRWHTELVAEAAAERLPDDGTALELCTGSGAIAMVLQIRRPRARVLAADIDPTAVANARANGVDARQGDLFAPFEAVTDAAIVVAVVPYVPTRALPLLQRDTFTFESALAYDGGEDGLDILRRVVAEAPRHLRPGGTLVLEVGAAQAGALDPDLKRHHYAEVEEVVDEDGDLRGITATAT